MEHRSDPSLESRWLELLRGLGVLEDLAVGAFRELSEHYSSPGRYYHTLAHIKAMLDSLSGCGEQAAQDPSLLLAVWFHDAVYDSRATDNEERSAVLADSVLEVLGIAEWLWAEVRRLVLMTKSHQAEPSDLVGQLLLDTDLAILGADTARYDAYAQQIRWEYDWVPDPAYKAARCNVLEGFLQRPRLFGTSAYIPLEPAARANLLREIAALQGPCAGASGS
jgi:predicted metal-dependent HD superfamily phosphohydrolase